MEEPVPVPPAADRPEPSVFVPASARPPAGSPSGNWLQRQWRRLRRWLGDHLTGGDEEFDITLGLLSILAWFLLFSIGYSVSSAPLFTRLNSPDTGLLRSAILMLQVLAVFALSNVGLLSALSALIGAIARRLTLASDARPHRGAQFFLAIVGSFLIFLVVTGGSYAILGLGFAPPPVPTEQPPVTAPAGQASSPEKALADANAAVEAAQNRYKNLAAFISILCLIEGYAPYALGMITKRFNGGTGTT